MRLIALLLSILLLAGCSGDSGGGSESEGSTKAANGGTGKTTVQAGDRKASEALHREAEAHFRSGDINAALKASRAAAKADPSDTKAGYFNASIHYMTRQFHEALEEIDRVLALDPGNPEMLARAGEIAYEAADYPRAIRYLAPIAERAQKNGMGPSSLRLATRYAVSLQRTTKAEDSIPHFEKALALAPKDAFLLRATASALMDRGRHADAIPYLERAIAERPDDWFLYDFYGTCLDKLGKKGEAIPWYRQALEKDRGQKKSSFAVAKCYLAIGKAAEAVPFIEIALEKLKDDPRVAMTASNVYRRVGRDEDVKRMVELHERLTEAEKKTNERTRQLTARTNEAPRDVDAAVELIEWYFDRGFAPQALEEAQRIRNLRPDSPRVIDWIGRLLVGRRDLDAARWEGRKLLEVAPQDWRGPALLAWVAALRKNWGEAVRWGEQTLRITGKHARTVAILHDAYQALGDQQKLAAIRPLYDEVVRESRK